MQSSLKRVSVVMPTLNEEKGIKATVSSIPKSELIKLGYELELIVIDGNSSDLTREVALQMGARVIVEKQKGYGLALKSGLKAASGDIIVTMDADGTYPADIIAECISLLEEKSLDFVTVDRFSRMEKGAMSRTHIVGNKILSAVMRLLYSVDVNDSQSGMCIMKKAFVDRISLNSNDFPVVEEMKIIAFKFYKALEVKGRYSRRIGEAKLQTIRHGWANLKYLFEFRGLLDSGAMSPEAVLPEIK